MEPDRKLAEEFLYAALNIGERMLQCGAEVNRVEDSLRRILKAHGAQRADVFTITSSIVVTIYAPSFGVVTQTRRVLGNRFDLTRLHMLNKLSRDLCAHPQNIARIDARLEEIDRAPAYPFWAQMCIYALISGSFSIFFGGTWRDGLAAAVIGVLLKLVDALQTRARLNPFFASFSSSLIGGLLAVIAVRLTLADHADLISIGSVMLLIPGIALTNAIRDMFSGDLISGLLRFADAMLIALTVAFGFVLAGRLL